MKLPVLILMACVTLFAAGEYSNRRAPGFSLADSHLQQHDPQENAVTPRTAKREMAIENPRRRRRAQKRNDAPAVAIPMQSPNEQLQHAGVDDETDKSAEAERQQLFQA